MVIMSKSPRSRTIKSINYECHTCGAIRPNASGPLFLCPECGTGMQRIVDEIRVPRPKRKQGRCQTCQGSGVVETHETSTPLGGSIPIMKPCERCKGSGKMMFLDIQKTVQAIGELASRNPMVPGDRK